LSEQKVFLKRIRHYLYEGVDICGAIEFLKSQRWKPDDNDLDIIADLIESNLDDEVTRCSRVGDLCTEACKITRSAFKLNVLTSGQAKVSTRMLREIIDSGKVHSAFVTMKECKAVLRVLEEHS